MRIGIVSNAEARGLEKDRQLITPILESLGHEVKLVQFDQVCDDYFWLLIFLEVVPRGLVPLCECAPWLVPNPEFLTPESIKIVQRSFGKVLCKTRESHRICTQLFGEKAHYVGFIAEDRFEPKIVRGPAVLHIAGKSKAKNTTAVIDAWRWKRNGESLKAKLIVVWDFPVDDLPDGVTVLHGLSDGELRNLQNVCQIHLQPSATEGWSHVIHEAMSVNASILTVDAPPMNEIHAAYKIPSVGSTAFHSARMHEVSALDIHNAVQDMLRLGRNGFAVAGMPRREFLDGNESFKKAFTAHLSDVGKRSAPVRVRSAGLQIAFLGNALNPESTENHIKWALEQGLGHEVEMLQEDEVRLGDIKEACDYADVFFWVRTLGWLRVPDQAMDDFLKQLKIPSVSIHLDKFWGIPARESLIGVHPFWHSNFVFTADGSRQDDFKKRGVNHIWMKPAVSEVYCHPGTPRNEYKCDVGFVGARSYHSEYPFRRQMIEFLEQTYGDRFKHIENVRGHLLNDVYASMKVVVGDCFAAGTPFYWSDRLPETCGRHGFLLHPEVEGLRWHEVATYKAQDLEDLQWLIEWWLPHEEERKHLRWRCADYTRKHDTWTDRMREILKVVWP